MEGREVSGKAGVSGSVDYSLFNEASRDKGDVLLGSKANELMSTISCQNYLALQGEGQAAHFSKENAESEQRSNSSKQSSSSQVQYMYDPRCQGQFPPHLIFNSCVKMQQQQPLLPEGKGASYNDHAEKARARRNQQKFKASSCSPKLSFRMHQQESLLPPVTQYSQTCTAIRHKDGTYEWLEVNVSSDRSCDTIMSGQLSTEGRSSPMSIMNSLNKKIQSKKARDASLHRKGALARYKVRFILVLQEESHTGGKPPVGLDYFVFIYSFLSFCTYPLLLFVSFFFLLFTEKEGEQKVHKENPLRK